jgi:hypothetical protein
VEAASVAALVSAFGVGGVAGIWARAEHERSERFRERMIQSSESFFGDIAEAKSALSEVALSVADSEEGRPNDAKVQEAEVAIAKVFDHIPVLSLVFPSFEQESEIFKPAFAIAESLREILTILVVDGASETGRRQLSRAQHKLVYHVGFFSSAAHIDIWRRWYMRHEPQKWLAVRARKLRKGEPNDLPAHSVPSAQKDLPPYDLRRPF